MSRMRSLILREPLGALGFAILFAYSVFALGAIGDGGGWMGIGRYDPKEQFERLNHGFVYERVSAALDGAPVDLSAAELRDRLADPSLYGVFADTAGVQAEIQDFLQPLIDDGELLDRLLAGPTPYLEIRRGILRDADRGFSRDANRPVVVAALDGPSAAHWFGTDRAGRDIYALVVQAAWRPLYFGLLTLLIGGGAAVLATAAAALLARVRGGALTKPAIGGLLDGAQAFPPLIILSLIFFAGGFNDIWMILGLAMIVLAPIYRSLEPSAPLPDQPLSWRVALLDPILRHRRRLILTLRNVVIAAVIGSTLIEFLGLSGLSPTWGGMIAVGRQFIIAAPWMSLMPGIALTLVLFGIYALGHGLANLSEDAGRASSEPDPMDDENA